jgi:hypothetical protein
MATSICHITRLYYMDHCGNQSATISNWRQLFCKLLLFSLVQLCCCVRIIAVIVDERSINIPPTWPSSCRLYQFFIHMVGSLLMIAILLVHTTNALVHSYDCDRVFGCGMRVYRSGNVSVPFTYSFSVEATTYLDTARTKLGVRTSFL